MLKCARQTVKLSGLGEFGLIGRLKQQFKSSRHGIQGIGDDTAVVPSSADKKLLLTTDMLVEGVHFTQAMPAKAVGHKAIAASISDIAAMGGTPKYAVVSLGAPASCPWDVVQQIAKGMQKTTKAFGVAIVGGDTVKARKMIINVTMTGEVKKEDVVYRRGARVGDKIYVTGPLGRSLKSGRHLRFVPRVAQSQYLRKFKPTAMIDISDGLVADLGHILTESRVGAVIEEKAIPKAKDARLKEALYDGEDFELLFTVPAGKVTSFEKHQRKPYRFYHIGQIVPKKEGLKINTSDGRSRKLNIKGYTHF